MGLRLGGSRGRGFGSIGINYGSGGLCGSSTGGIHGLDITLSKRSGSNTGRKGTLHGGSWGRLGGQEGAPRGVNQIIVRVFVGWRDLGGGAQITRGHSSLSDDGGDDTGKEKESLHDLMYRKKESYEALVRIPVLKRLKTKRKGGNKGGG